MQVPLWLFALLFSQFEGSALGTLTLGRRTTGASNLNVLQGTALLGSVVVGTTTDGTVDVGIAITRLLHNKKPPEILSIKFSSLHRMFSALVV